MRLRAPVNPLIDAQVAAPAFAAPLAPSYAGISPDDTQPMLLYPTLVGAGAGVAAAGGGGYGAAVPPRRRPRVTPITWTGAAAPLLDAVRQGGAGALPSQPTASRAAAVAAGSASSAGETQLMPRFDPSDYGDGYGDRYGDHASYDRDVAYVDGREPWGSGPEYQLDGRDPGEPVRHAWYPGRRVDLGLVLLPLRIFLGAISIYAGFSKVCDPVYFDGGSRGSMMHWLQSLHPWALAQPLLHIALNHPVGAGLGVAFVQIVVGVLSILGLWQRLAAGTAMLLALALLVTVSWRMVPAYDAPEIIYLAAWSPLLLAGAPLFSLDGRLAIEAWHRLGERAPVSVLRRRVLRRGFVVATMVIGSTLLLGSALGAAVRNGQTTSTTLPGSPEAPSVYPSPMWPAQTPSAHPSTAKPSARPSASASPSTSPSASASHHPSSRHTGSSHGGAGGSASQGTGGSTSKPSQRHSGSPSPSPGGGNGVIGGLLGSAAPLPLLGMTGQGSVGGRSSGPSSGAGPVV
ncbi:DoxX family protein [Streptacidiphilus sp. MAP12-16]|uniref:DoxX family protein n=1 Tax=Streptacidiphilus sp. MAP12-16 TaxID=3156300 RepID=UPI003519C693